jgi:D-alanyl-D-alanine carboxypeptidase/D-alanyl-D-alanine-endopeptidase (penicillin-binding protein 4)
MRRAERLAALLPAAILLTSVAAAQSPRRGTAGSPLAARLDALLDSVPFNRALWGVAIMDPSGRVAYQRNADRLFVPASNTKLVVAAVAAAMLGPDYRFRTSIYGAGQLDSGVLRGDLVLYGRGDPTLSRRYHAGRLAAFEELADTLQRRGLRRVEGDVVADASYFDSVTVHPSWSTYDVLWWYAAPVSAVGFNDNAVDFGIAPGDVGGPPAITFAPDLGLMRFTNHARTAPPGGPRTLQFHRAPGGDHVWATGDVPADARPWEENVAVADGPVWAATALRAALEGRGIVVTGRVRRTFDSTAYAAARRAVPLAQHHSVPLEKILEPILASSHNWFAEMILKTLGREFRGRGTWEAGLTVERRFLVDSLRVDSTMFRLADGSGLSHENLMTPLALVQLLRRIREHPRGEAFLEALPEPGDGTLRFRFRRDRPAGLVRAKTGSIASVNTLSGYLETAFGVWTYAIQVNNHAAPNRDALNRIDAIVAALGR